MKKLILISLILCIAIIGCASAAVADSNATTTTAAATTTAPQLIGGDRGAYLVNANVDGANVTFDNDYKGVITGGQLKVDVYTTGTPYRVVTVEKAGYGVTKVNITNYPGKGETVVMNVTLVKLVQTTAATTTAAMGTAPAVIKANATAPAIEVTTVATTAAATTPSPTPTKAGSLPVVACASFGLIGILSLRSRR
jgi:hypothetical protein